MSQRYLTSLALAACLAIATAAAPIAEAQTTDAPDSVAAPQTQKAQRKADRKARRAAKNAELRKLEKNGYNPGGNQINYPKNLENAERKAAAQDTGKAAPASAP